MKTIKTGPTFTPGELQAMHRYCLKFRDLVRGGGTPSGVQSTNFLLFQRITYAFEVAYAG
jgi:hypothetical protein